MLTLEKAPKKAEYAVIQYKERGNNKYGVYFKAAGRTWMIVETFNTMQEARDKVAEMSRRAVFFDEDGTEL